MVALCTPLFDNLSEKGNAKKVAGNEKLAANHGMVMERLDVDVNITSFCISSSS